MEKPLPKLSLIDLHRALIKRKLSVRWTVKDIAGLYFSAMDIGLTRHDLLRFIKYYGQADLRQSYLQKQDFWNAVQERARRMYLNLGPAK